MRSYLNLSDYHHYYGNIYIILSGLYHKYIFCIQSVLGVLVYQNRTYYIKLDSKGDLIKCPSKGELILIPLIVYTPVYIF
jgi:hypothetical protein